MKFFPSFSRRLSCAGVLLVLPVAKGSVDAFQASWAAPGGSTRTADYVIYTPAAIDVPRVRGVVFLYPGSGGDWRFRSNDVVWQEAARSLGFAVIGAGGTAGFISITETEARASLTAILAAAATASGRGELVNAPIVSTGFSLGGFTSTELACKIPERVLAAVGHRGGNTFAASQPEKTRQVPILWIPGSLDNNPLTNVNVATDSFAGYRNASTGGRAALAVDWLTYHDSFTNQGWSMAWTWIAEAVALRYPAGQVPSTEPGNPLVLDSIPETSGWLGQRTYATSTTGADRSTFTPIASYADYTGDKFTASWLPNETVARVYQAFNSYDGVAGRSIPQQGPLALVGDTAPGTVVQSGQTNPPQMAVWPVGSTINLTVDPRTFDDVGSIVSLRYYDGSRLLGVLTTAGPSGWSIPHTLTTPGIHSITVVATDSAGNQSSAFRSVVAVPARAGGATHYRFESSPGLVGDQYDVLRLGRSGTAGSGPEQVTLPATGPGSAFPRLFSFAEGGNTRAARLAVASSQAFSTPDHASLPSGAAPFTIEAFVNLSSSGAGGLFRTIAGHGNTAAANNFGWQFIVTGEGSGQGPRRLLFQFTPDGIGGAGSSLDTINSGFELQAGVDYYVALVFDPANTGAAGARFYFKNLTAKGPLQSSERTHIKTSVWNSSSAFTVGNGWDGLLDEVRLTRRALSPAELLINQVTLPVPASLAATAGANPGEIHLTWSAASQAGSYRIERSTTAGSGFAVIGEMTTTTFTDTALSAGQTYYYRIRAADGSILSNYTTESSASPFIPDTFPGWRYVQFGPDAAPADSDALADPDGDGLANLLEYALATDPHSASSGPASAPVSSLNPDGRLTLGFTRLRSDLIYAVQAGEDLVSWISLGENPGLPGQSITVTDTVPFSPRRYLRLRVTLPAPNP